MIPSRRARINIPMLPMTGTPCASASVRTALSSVRRPSENDAVTSGKVVLEIFLYQQLRYSPRLIPVDKPDVMRGRKKICGGCMKTWRKKFLVTTGRVKRCEKNDLASFPPPRFRLSRRLFLRQAGPIARFKWNQGKCFEFVKGHVAMLFRNGIQVN
jgi:hypothetical protein